MKQTIMASLAYIGRTQEWLAEELDISENTLRDRLNREGTWRLSELKIMQKLFRWKTLTGPAVNWEGGMK